MRVDEEKQKSRFLGLNLMSIFYTVISETKAQLIIEKSKKSWNQQKKNSFRKR